jgi:hypothetical protein
LLKLNLEDIPPGSYLLEVSSWEHRTVLKILRR